MNSEMTRKLALLCVKDPFYLGWWLDQYSELMSTDAPGIASGLGGLPEVVPEMSLCRSPNPESSRFRQDVEAIADRFQVRAEALANIIRTVQVASERDYALLLAARDRESPAVADGSAEYGSDDANPNPNPGRDAQP